MSVSGTTHRVLVDTVWHKTGMWREVILVAAGCLLIALSAQVQFYLPFSPVPITGQTFAILLIGALYGSRRGAATVIAYLAMGAAGFPVFAGGGFGLAKLVGPTAGYLIGFVGAAYVVGLLSEKGWDRNLWTTAISMLLGTILIYIAGVTWLGQFVGWQAVMATGVYPFLLGDGFKIILAAILLPSGWQLIGRLTNES